MENENNINNRIDTINVLINEIKMLCQEMKHKVEYCQESNQKIEKTLEQFNKQVWNINEKNIQNNMQIKVIYTFLATIILWIAKVTLMK